MVLTKIKPCAALHAMMCCECHCRRRPSLLPSNMVMLLTALLLATSEASVNQAVLVQDIYPGATSQRTGWSRDQDGNWVPVLQEVINDAFIRGRYNSNTPNTRTVSGPSAPPAIRACSARPARCVRRSSAQAAGAWRCTALYVRHSQTRPSHETHRRISPSTMVRCTLQLTVSMGASSGLPMAAVRAWCKTSSPVHSLAFWCEQPSRLAAFCTHVAER